MPLIKFKGIKVLKRTDKIIKAINMDKLNIKYGDYIYAIKTQDNINHKDINIFKLKQNSLIENNYLDIIEDNNTIMKLYINKSDKKNKYNKLINHIGKNITEESYNDLESRKLFNKLLLPHYFFTTKYNEKNIPSQIRS
jgi:predicted transcriptional regulator